MEHFPVLANTRIGILGSGQLGKMLAESAEAMGIRVRCLANHLDEPAVRNGRDAIVGASTDSEALKVFLKDLDFVLFENEFIDTTKFKELEKNQKEKFRPVIDSIEKLRDKREQKKALDELGIPNPRWTEYFSGESVSDWLLRVQQQFPKGAVLKWARQGYDGKGVLVVSNTKEDLARAAIFVTDATKRNIPLFAEEKILFQRELAVIGVFSTKGEFRCYPVVESVQKESVCFKVRGPAIRFGLDPKREEAIRDWVEQFARRQRLVGCFGIELFDTGDQIYVNEVAPRVHNSGHYTQNGAVTSQFENHVRACLGLPLGETECHQLIYMRNLLGPTGVIVDGQEFSLPAVPSFAHLHWYGKNGVQPRRKVGHVNFTAKDTVLLTQRETELEKVIGEWEKVLHDKKK